MTEMQFVDELPNPSHRRRRGHWVTVADEIKRNPGQWGRVHEDADRLQVTNARQQLGRQGLQVSAVRKSEATWDVYASFRVSDA